MTLRTRKKPVETRKARRTGSFGLTGFFRELVPGGG